MYLKFYKLREFPFAISCDERFFYESAAHAEALANMMYAIGQRKGMVLVTGEVGAGKTFVGHVLRGRLGAGCLTVSIANPPQSAKQLLRALASGAGMNVRAGSDKLDLVEQLESHLGRLHQRGRLVALILDEAQNLNGAALEEVRMLWNLERDGQRLIQIVLIGQPELRHRLLEPKWEPLRQRVVLSYHLGHLSQADTAGYVRHRLKVAGSEGCLAQFAPEALSEVFAATDGIPRLINVLCDNALLVGYAKSSPTISQEIVREVLRDMTCWGLTVARPADRPSPPDGQTGQDPAPSAPDRTESVST